MHHLIGSEQLCSQALHHRPPLQRRGARYAKLILPALPARMACISTKSGRGAQFAEVRTDAESRMAKVMNDIAQRLAARGGRAQPAGADPTAELRVRLEAAVEVMQEGLVERDTEVGACRGASRTASRAADPVPSACQGSAALAGPCAARLVAGTLASAGATGVSAT